MITLIIILVLAGIGTGVFFIVKNKKASVTTITTGNSSVLSNPNDKPCSTGSGSKS